MYIYMSMSCMCLVQCYMYNHTDKFECEFVRLLVFFLRAPNQRYSILYMWRVIVDTCYDTSSFMCMRARSPCHDEDAQTQSLLRPDNARRDQVVRYGTV